MKIPYTHKIVKTYMDGEKVIAQDRQIRYLFGLVKINHYVEVRTENTFKTFVDVYLAGIRIYNVSFYSEHAYPFYVNDITYNMDIFDTKSQPSNVKND